MTLKALHLPEVHSSAEHFREGNGDQGGGSLVGFDGIELLVDVSDEGGAEGVGLGVKQQVKHSVPLLEDCGLSELFGGNLESCFDDFDHPELFIFA